MRRERKLLVGAAAVAASLAASGCGPSKEEACAKYKSETEVLVKGNYLNASETELRDRSYAVQCLGAPLRSNEYIYEGT